MIRLTELVYTAGTFRLEISLEVLDGEYFVILGPTGSGKTAAVECLAGLRQPNSGRIEISGKEATWAEPRSRMVGYVPQDYALFMHRSVRRNIAFGPEVRGWPASEIDRVVRESARLIGIERLLDRRIPGLSGGERQRVALARALAMKPEVLILDEPVSALDESTRESVCAEMRRIQRELKLTTIHISHNLEEAFSVADRAAVMHDGRIEQIGTMDELLRRPRNRFVARFMRGENVLVGRAEGEGKCPGTTCVGVGGVRFVLPGARSGEVAFLIRPENMVLGRGSGTDAGDGEMTGFRARLVRGVDRGAYVRLELEAFQPLVANLSVDAFARLGCADGDEVEVRIPADAIHVLGD